MNNKILIGVLAVAAVMSSVAEVNAAETAAGAPVESIEAYSDTVGLGEVSVSAIKGGARRYPAAVTDLNIQAIERYDITGIKEISEISPNLYMPQYGSRMTSTIYVRGLGTRIDQPVVAFNVDNVQILNKDNFDFVFPDLCNVEVVRGPQSILYGRNSMGGVINLTTLSPLDYQGVKALAEYGSGNTWRAWASAYARPSATLGVSVSAAMNSTDGFFTNIYNNKKVDTERNGMAKLKVAWRPSRRFTLENSVWTTITRQGGYAYESLASHEINHNDTCYYRRDNVVDGLTMRYSGDNVSVASITGFQYLNDNMTLDQDFLPEDYFTLTQKRHEWSVTQDFVVKGAVESYSHLSGLWGFYRRYNMSAPVTFKDYGLTHLIEDNINSQLPPVMQLKWDERQMLLASDFMSPSWGWALYHKSEYSIDRLTASVGLRLAFERVDFDYHSYVNTSATMYTLAGPRPMPIASRPISIDLADRLHQTSLQLLPEFKVAYRLTDGMTLGAVISKGYKSGGYNTQMFSDILQQQMMTQNGSAESAYDTEEVISYKPEYSWNYEVDFSAKLPEAGLSLEASAFILDCRDQQMTVFPEGTTTGRMMANAGRTRCLGLELSTRWTPTKQLSLTASYGLADARFRDYDNGITQFRGKHVPYAPENTLFASATYKIALGNGFARSLEPTLTCRGIGNIYWDEENSVKQPFYALMGASVTLRTTLCDIDLWGENLTGTKYSTFYFESIGNKFVQRGNPRRVGVTVRFDFDMTK